MRFTTMLNPFKFAGSEISSAKQIEDALEELYSFKPHVAATAGICLAGFSAFMSGAVQTGVYASLVAVICLFFRIFIQVLFVRRTPGPLHAKWTRLFVAGSLFSGFGWGVSCASLLYDASPTTQTVVVAIGCAIVQGAAGRAYMIPGTAIINIAFVLGLTGISAYTIGNYFILLGCTVYFWFLFSFIVLMVKNRVQQLRAEQLTVRLLNEITEKNEQLRIANDKLAATAFEDPLTGLANRRRLDLFLQETLWDAKKNRSFVSLMMIDVDNFKSFNDTYGHQAGDQCLQAISRSLAGTIGEGFVARYGGEEFVVIIPDCDSTTGILIAERTRLAVQLMELQSIANSPPRQTISIGLVSCRASPELTGEMLLSTADAALYDAKKQGRNRVCVHSIRDGAIDEGVAANRTMR